MTPTDEDAAYRAADAQQAALFRAALCDERDYISDAILKRRALIERRAYASRVRADAHSAEAQVRFLDRLIAQIDRRYPANADEAV